MKWKLGIYGALWGLGLPKIKGTIFGGPNNKDYSIWVSTLGSLYLGKLPSAVDPPNLVGEGLEFWVLGLNAKLLIQKLLITTFVSGLC